MVLQPEDVSLHTNGTKSGLQSPTSPDEPPKPSSDKVKGPIKSPELRLDSPPEAPDTSDSTESGWSAVSDIITKVDEGKIKDYKEDIDTILVFAGLYSAVLTGLLAESITNLQQDPNTVVISLLVQLTNQTHSYSLGSGFLNSTSPTPNLQPPPFTPSLAAKRVNILWFASLMLSLISASFGILVKQWLREYLAGTYVSPEARLRVRHFREPGLEHWKVFGIAAILPLFLQLSLALFFVGLCFFTLDIHNSVGYTTIPLVAAWAVLFVAASFAPVLSPRCPYKTPSLKSFMTFLRKVLFHCIAFFRGFPDLGPKSSWIITPKWTWHLLAYTEKDAETSSKTDVEVLLTTDKTQLDDHLLRKVCSALQEMRVTPETMVSFALNVVASRLQDDPESIPKSITSRLQGSLPETSDALPPMLDLTRLPSRTCTILMDSLARTLEPEVNKVPLSDKIIWSDGMKDCMALLCAKLPCLLPENANRALLLCFSGKSWVRTESTIKLLTSGTPRDQNFVLGLHLQERLRPMLLQLDSASFHFCCLSLTKLYCDCHVRRDPRPCATIGTTLRRHRTDMGVVLENHTLELLISYLSYQLDLGISWSHWHRSILGTISNQWPVGLTGTWRDAFVALADRMLTDRESSRLICCTLFDHGHYNKSAADVCELAFQSSQYPQQILSNVKDSLEAYLDESEVLQTYATPEFRDTLIRFLLGQVTWIHRLIGWSPPNIRHDYMPFWQGMGRRIAKVLKAHHARHNHHSLLAGRCLDQFMSLHREWMKQPASSGSGALFFEEDIIDSITKLIPPDPRAPSDANSQHGHDWSQAPPSISVLGNMREHDRHSRNPSSIYSDGFLSPSPSLTPTPYHIPSPPRIPSPTSVTTPPRVPSRPQMLSSRPLPSPITMPSPSIVIQVSGDDDITESHTGHGRKTPLESPDAGFSTPASTPTSSARPLPTLPRRISPQGSDQSLAHDIIGPVTERPASSEDVTSPQRSATHTPEFNNMSGSTEPSTPNSAVWQRPPLDSSSPSYGTPPSYLGANTKPKDSVQDSSYFE